VANFDVTATLRFWFPYPVHGIIDGTILYNVTVLQQLLYNQVVLKFIIKKASLAIANMKGRQFLFI
jgi:hypothetical protein